MKKIVCILFLAIAATSVSSAQSNGGHSRSAKTGQYVSGSYAKKHPSTTVTERRRTTSPAATRKRQ
jgi:FMN-dependent NADH-azoreductase